MQRNNITSLIYQNILWYLPWESSKPSHGKCHQVVGLPDQYCHSYKQAQKKSKSSKYTTEYDHTFITYKCPKDPKDPNGGSYKKWDITVIK
jgi:hypothetical protein